MIKGNKGEWSEIYTFLKLLADKNIYSGDSNLNRRATLYYPIIKILRQERDGNYEYKVKNKSILSLGNKKEITLPVSDFKSNSEYLFDKILEGKGSFSVPIIERFMKKIFCKSLKAKSKDKTDIKVVIHDLRTGLEHLLGFSIKSKLGGPSTLFNANKVNTNFTYEILGINTLLARKVNKLLYFKDKFKLLKDNKAKIKFIKPSGDILNNNLKYVDYCLPEIAGNIVQVYFSTENTNIADIVSVIRKSNPLKFDLSFNQDFYEHKVKRFLTNVALGLKPGKTWNGKYDATGGFLIIKEDGDIVCYHIYDKNQFEEYLFNNTKLDTPSTQRHNFGHIYQKKGRFYLDLNLQIRFI